jgi:hypothetical protein
MPDVTIDRKSLWAMLKETWKWNGTQSSALKVRLQTRAVHSIHAVLAVREQRWKDSDRLDFHWHFDLGGLRLRNHEKRCDL